MRPTDQESGVLDDAELLGPLPQPLLAPQEGTDAGITHQLDAGLGRGPLVGGRLALAAFLLIIGLVGAAHSLSILCKEDPLGHSPARPRMLLNMLVWGGQQAGAAAGPQATTHLPLHALQPTPQLPTADPGRLSDQSVLDVSSGHRHK